MFVVDADSLRVLKSRKPQQNPGTVERESAWDDDFLRRTLIQRAPPLTWRATWLWDGGADDSRSRWAAMVDWLR